MTAKKKPAKRSGKKAADAADVKRKRLGVAIGFVLVSACMFFIGVLVGRGTAPVQFDIQALQDELLELRQTVEAKRRQMMEGQPAGSGKAEDLEFYEALKATDDATAKDPLQQLADYQPEPPSASETPATTEPPAPKTADVPTPAPETPPKEQPAVKPPAVSVSAKPSTPAAPAAKLTIQVASVRDSRSAGLMVEKLRKKGYPAYSSATRIPGKGVWYRVRIGEFDSRPVAERMLQKLKKDHLSGKVVSRS